MMLPTGQPVLYHILKIIGFPMCHVNSPEYGTPNNAMKAFAISLPFLFVSHNFCSPLKTIIPLFHKVNFALNNQL